MNYVSRIGMKLIPVSCKHHLRKQEPPTWMSECWSILCSNIHGEVLHSIGSDLDLDLDVRTYKQILTGMFYSSTEN